MQTPDEARQSLEAAIVRYRYVEVGVALAAARTMIADLTDAYYDAVKRAGQLAVLEEIAEDVMPVCVSTKHDDDECIWCAINRIRARLVEQE